jgi:hypothetical protein
MIAWGRAVIGAMNGFKDTGETGLTRMFRTEYAKEYHLMRKNGYEINDRFVRTFLELRKHS